MEATIAEELTMVKDGGLRAEPAGDWRRFQLAGSVPEGYERYLVPVLFAPWADRVLDLVGLRPGERVLDVACGTGVVARAAVHRVGTGGTVVGVDSNAGMIRVARCAATGVTEWRVGNAENLPFDDGAFDAVVCQQGLQFFADRSAALGEMRRVAAEGGRLGLAVWRAARHVPGYHVLAKTLERRLGMEAANMMRAPFLDVTAVDLHVQLERAGFRRVEVRIEVGAARFPSAAEWLRRQAASSPLAGPVGALDADGFDALAGELTDALGEYTDDDGVAFPLQAYLASATAGD